MDRESYTAKNAAWQAGSTALRIQLLIKYWEKSCFCFVNILGLWNNLQKAP